MNIQDIHNQHRPSIIRYLTRLTGNFEDAEDLTQEVFIKVGKNLNKFRGDSSLSTWIYKIATNTANDFFRSVSFRNNSKQTIFSSELSKKMNDEIALMNIKKLTPEQQLIKDEMNGCIDNYIQQLNENYRTIILLCDYEGLKNKEVAEVLEVSIDAVKIRLHRARAKLKIMMNKGCDVYYNNGEIGCNEK